MATAHIPGCPPCSHFWPFLFSFQFLLSFPLLTLPGSLSILFMTGLVSCALWEISGGI